MSRNTDDAEGRKIFIGGLPFSTDEDLIRRDFGKFGDIDDVYLPRDRETNKLRGFGFVTFKDPRDARDAADDMNRREFEGREITVNIARPRGADGRGSGHGGYGGDRHGGRDRGYDRDERGGYGRGGYDRDRGDYDRSRDRDYDRRGGREDASYGRGGYDRDRRGDRDDRRDDSYGPGYTGYSFSGRRSASAGR